ncbi:MAG: FAD-binding protein [Chloroflexota bacterium]|nr:FAD-binding protein [Chloroflexota bacterium]
MFNRWTRQVNCDVLVIGGGLGGTFAAIKAEEAGAGKVVLVSKGKLGKDSVSTFAAGVMSVIMPGDDFEAEFRNYALGEWSGAGIYDPAWLKIAMEENYDRVRDMESYGVQWARKPDGQIERRAARGVVLKGTFMKPFMDAMANKVRSTSVEVAGHIMLTGLLTENGQTSGRVVGAVGFDTRTGDFCVFKARAVVMAAGGCSFKPRFAGCSMSTGDGYTLPYRAGAKMGSFELGHFHQMSAAAFDTAGMNLFVALGGHFINARGERFMQDYFPNLVEFADLTSVSQASAMEMRAGRTPVYLDMTHFPPASVNRIRTALRSPTKALERMGIMVGDKIVSPIEYAPCFRGTYSMGGGIVTDIECATSLPGLYAVGDSRCRPEQEPAALAGAAVTGARAGIFAARFAKESGDVEIDRGQLEELEGFTFAPMERQDGIEPDHIITENLETIVPYEVVLIARGERLEKALKEVRRIQREEVSILYASDLHYLRMAHEAANILLTTEMYLNSYLTRKESRRACFREDYPYTDNINWLRNTRLKLEKGEMQIWTEELPYDSLPLKPERTKRLHPIFEVARRKGIPWG